MAGILFQVWSCRLSQKLSSPANRRNCSNDRKCQAPRSHPHPCWKPAFVQCPKPIRIDCFPETVNCSSVQRPLAGSWVKGLVHDPRLHHVRRRTQSGSHKAGHTTANGMKKWAVFDLKRLLLKHLLGLVVRRQVSHWHEHGSLDGGAPASVQSSEPTNFVYASERIGKPPGSAAVLHEPNVSLRSAFAPWPDLSA